MEDESDLNLVKDHFDDLAIDDEPLDLGSEAGSYFDEDEMRSRNEEEDALPTSEEFTISKRYRPSRQAVANQMPTISEEHDLTRITKADSKGTTSQRQSPVDNSNEFSLEFKDANLAMDDYEKMYFSNENRADRLFKEDDLRFRQNKFEKENSWEPSIIDIERQPSPEVVKNTANILKSNKLIPNTNSPPQNSIFLNSPNANSTQTSGEAKTSTPKRPESARFGQRLKPPQLEISTISSIHALSPNRAPSFVKNSPSSISMMSNVTLNKSDVRNIIKNYQDNDLLTALENARKGRGRDTMKEKMNFRRDATISKPAPIPEVFEEPSREVSRLSTARSSTSNTSTLRKAQSNVEREPDLQTVFHSENSRSQRTTSRASMISTASSTGSERKHSNLLKISRRRLAFGAVEIGDQMSMELEMQNVSDRMLHVRASIDSNTKAFEIVDNKLALIEPGQKSKVRVVFKPENAGRYQVCLEIDVQSPSLHYVIPLWGCGGMASIKPIVEDELESSSNTKDYILRTSKFSKLTFRLRNEGHRDGFARIDVYDAAMKPVKCRVLPSNAIMLRRKRECQLEVKLPSGATFVAAVNETTTSRACSVMSSVSTNSRRSTLGGADYVIEIKWGEELLRQRLKILEKESRQKILIDGLDYTSIQFENEEALKPTQGFPKIVPDDRSLFEATYRTTSIMVFSTRSSRQMDSYRTSSSSISGNLINPETSILETSAFRYQTFVRDQDATIMPKK